MGLTVFYWYLGIGLIVLASLSIYRTWIKSSDGPGSVHATSKPKVTWKQRIGPFFLYPLVYVFIFVPLWPLLVSIELNLPWHKLKFWTSKAERSVAWTLPDAEPEFKVSPSDLVEKLTKAEIEAIEHIDDPLNAVPNLPFGHLNRVWLAFVDSLEPDRELWSFRGRWKTSYSDDQMQGYVALLGGEIGPYFLTSIGEPKPTKRTIDADFTNENNPRSTANLD